METDTHPCEYLRSHAKTSAGEIWRSEEAFPDSYAIAGGLAASFYRTKPRLTNDVDIAFYVRDESSSREAAQSILREMGFRTSLGWIANRGEGDKPVALVIGYAEEDERSCTLDFLLPTLPWVPTAVRRAQHNKIDFKFALVPTVTPEDISIAKAYALKFESKRFTDLDDIQSILQADNRLDAAYLVSEFERHELLLPASLTDVVPRSLFRLIGSRAKR